MQLSSSVRQIQALFPDYDYMATLSDGGNDERDAARRQRERALAPRLIGPFVGLAVFTLIHIALVACGTHPSARLEDAIAGVLVVIVGPLAIHQLIQRRPDWLEHGFDDGDHPSRPSA